MDVPLDLKMLLRYPLILTKGNSEYRGYLSVNDVCFKINLKVNEYTNEYELEINKELERFQTKIQNLSVNERIENVVQYLDELVEIISVDLKIDRIKNNANIYRTVLNEYHELREFFINIHKATVSKDLQQINIEQFDVKNRKHKVTIYVNYINSDKLFRITECDIPESKEAALFQAEDSLVALYEKFLAKIECPKLQMIFGILDEIDKSCWVLDPEKPSRKDLYRRIMLETNVSVVIMFNSSDIRDLPWIKFLGPQSTVKKYNEILNKNVTNWNPNEDVLLGLLKLLEISHFPPKPKDLDTEELLVNEGECCICFCLRLNGKMPEVVCPNLACNQYFHTDCLYQYLCSLNCSKSYFEILGQCPNCDKAIRCPLSPEK